MNSRAIQISSEAYQVKQCLKVLWFVFTLGLMTLQAFNVNIDLVANDTNGLADAALITAFPSLAIGISTFIYSTLSDAIALQKIYKAGIVFLLVGTLGGYFLGTPLGISLGLNDIWLLILFRCIQTFGTHCSACMYLVLCSKYLESKERVMYLGFYTAGTQVAVIFGVLLGSLLYMFGFQMLFLIPVPGLVLAPYLLKRLPKRKQEERHVDWSGLVLFSLFACIFTYACMTWYIWALLLSLISGALFALYIHRAKTPFVTPQFFANRTWLISSCAMLFFYMPSLAITPILRGMGSALFHLDAEVISVCIIVPVFVGVVFGFISGRLAHKLGDAGSVLLAALLDITAFMLAIFAIPANFLVVCLALSLYFAGVSVFYSPLTDIIVNALPKELAGRAVGLITFFTQLGASIGSALLVPYIEVDPTRLPNFFMQTPLEAQYDDLFLGALLMILIPLILIICIKRPPLLLSKRSYKKC